MNDIMMNEETDDHVKFPLLAKPVRNAVFGGLCRYLYRDRNTFCSLPTYCNTIYCVMHLCHGCLKQGLIDEVNHVYDDVDIGFCKKCLDWELNASSIDTFYGNCVIILSKICPECKCDLSMPHMKIEHFAMSTCTHQQKKTARRLCTALHIWSNLRLTNPCVCVDNTCYVSTLASMFKNEPFEKWFRCDKETVFKKICNRLKTA